jgi:hypothetical protein
MPRRNIDELLIAHLATGKTIRESARLIGCGEATARRRLADPAFRRAVQKAKREMVEAIRGDLRKAASLAVATLEALLTSDEPSIRLRAAEAILSHFRALHPEAATEPEEKAGERQVKIVYEIVSCNSQPDPNNQDAAPQPPADKPQRIDFPQR